MKNILVINASSRLQESISRNLSETFIDYYKKTDSACQVTCRDLGNGETPHISQAWIDADAKKAADRSPAEKEILRYSDTYLKELRDADIIVLATPMYNWSLPSVLKAYVDQVMRLNETFAVNLEKGAQRYIGLLNNKTLVLLFSRGSRGYEKGERNEFMNFQSNYLRMVSGIMGITHIHEVVVNGTSRKDKQFNIAIEDAHIRIENLIQQEFLSHEE